MRVIEIRIPLPMTLEEFQVGQLYTVGAVSVEKTNDDTAAIVLVNEPFDNERGKGQYTHKVFNLGSYAPPILRSMFSAKSFEMHEKAWNCYPFCRTEYSSPFLGSLISCVVETIHLPDRGETFNAHNLSDEMLKLREVKFLDIAKDFSKETSHEEVAAFVPDCGRGPLTGNWMETVEPVMCCYKLTTIKCNIPFVSGKVISAMEANQVELLLEFAKQCYLRINKWHGMTMDDIRVFEENVKIKLEELKADKNDGTESVVSAGYSNVSSTSMKSSKN